jgi:hypothetical protein
MSKSENQMATIYLADDDDAIRKKVLKAKTDNGPTEMNSAKPEYIENVFLLMKLVSSEQVPVALSPGAERSVRRGDRFVPDHLHHGVADAHVGRAELGVGHELLGSVGLALDGGTARASDTRGHRIGQNDQRFNDVFRLS